MLMKNKKGQTATGLILIVAIALFFTTLLAMHSVLNAFEENSLEINSIINEINLNHNYVKLTAMQMFAQTLSECPNCNTAQLKQKFKMLSTEKEVLFKYEGAGNFYGKVRNGEFEISENKIIIESLFVEAQNGYNKIRRDFVIEIKLDDLK